MCNKLFEMVCDIYEDKYDKCESHICLVQLLGIEHMLRMCENCGLDKQYPMEYMEIKNKLDSEEEGNES